MRSESPFVFDWLFEHARSTPHAPAIGTPTRWTTYGELAAAVRVLADELAESGIGPGVFVVVSLPAGSAAAASMLAIQALGACAVAINRELDPRTIAGILHQTGAPHAIVHGRDAAIWAELVRVSEIRSLHIVFPGTPPPRMQQLLQNVTWRWIDEHSPSADSTGGRHSPHRDAEAAALLVYTSGSTGEPRGVLQSHANVEANTRAICTYLELTSTDRALSILPLFYCFGQSILHTHLLAGGAVFFDHRFMYPQVVMTALAEQACTGFYGVPLTFEMLRRQVDVRKLALRSLRYVAQAGGAMQPETVRWAREAFAPAQLFVMYGQTEATARLSYLPPERAVDKGESIGRGLENVELRVVDSAGNELPSGEVGQLVARGPSITRGYFAAPAETAEILREGWLWTGDLAFHDDEGFVFLVGRSKDMLKLGGHRVSPAEIEQVLLEHPSVREAAVVGAPDTTAGEAAVAFLVVAAGAALETGEFRRFCRERLPSFKIPRDVHIVDELPRTPTGKIAKAILRGRLST